MVTIEKNKKVSPDKEITSFLSLKFLSRKNKLTIIEFLKFFLSAAHLDKNKRTITIVGGKILSMDMAEWRNE
jgi:hypothetical protein